MASCECDVIDIEDFRLLYKSLSDRIWNSAFKPGPRILSKILRSWKMFKKLAIQAARLLNSP